MQYYLRYLIILAQALFFVKYVTVYLCPAKQLAAQYTGTRRRDTGRSRVHREAKCARIEILWTGAGVVELAALEKR